MQQQQEENLLEQRVLECEYTDMNEREREKNIYIYICIRNVPHVTKYGRCCRCLFFYARKKNTHTHKNIDYRVHDWHA